MAQIAPGILSVSCRVQSAQEEGRMVSQQILDGLSKAEKAEVDAQNEAKRLVDELLSAADMLRSWQDIAFEWTEGGNAYGHPSPLPSGKQCIRVEAYPTLLQVAKAITNWQVAKQAWTAALNQLTEDDRRMLGKLRVQ